MNRKAGREGWLASGFLCIYLCIEWEGSKMKNLGAQVVVVDDTCSVSLSVPFFSLSFSAASPLSSSSDIYVAQVYVI